MENKLSGKFHVSWIAAEYRSNTLVLAKNNFKSNKYDDFKLE